MNCLNCENVISAGKYCSNKCQVNYQNKNKISEWLFGKNFVRQGGTTVPNWIRNYLLDLRNHRCEKCQWHEINPATNKVPLEIDHIDGDSQNNLFDNLRVLCPNCHSLTITYKNTGSRKSTRINRKKK